MWSYLIVPFAWIMQLCMKLLNNYALQSFLGVTTFLGASKDTKKAAAMGASVTVVMTLSGFLTWLVNEYVLAAFGLEYLQTLVFVAVILAVAYLVGAAAKAVVKKPLGVFFPLVALNSAVLGVTLNNVTEGYDLLQALVSSVAVGLGFLLAMVLFSGLRSRIDETNVPRPFRGLAVTLIAASFISLAFMGFAGIVDALFA